MAWALVVDRGKRKGTVIPIRRFPFAMGRDDDCQLRAFNPYISHHHCELRSQGDRVTICDCNSTNGTFINSLRIDEEVELHEGDRIKIGSLTFLVCQHNPNGVAASPPDHQLDQEPASPKTRKVDEDTIGDMLLDLEEPDSGPPVGAWKNSSSENSDSKPGNLSVSVPRKAQAASGRKSSAPDIASKMLEGTDTSWVKPT